MNSGFCAEGEESDATGAAAPDLLDEAIKRHVRRVLVKYASNVTRAAVALGISRTTLRKWL
jgi:transcriptional regulator with PAS, ATPase and Fis domain